MNESFLLQHEHVAGFWQRCKPRDGLSAWGNKGIVHAQGSPIAFLICVLHGKWYIVSANYIHVQLSLCIGDSTCAESKMYMLCTKIEVNNIVHVLR